MLTLAGKYQIILLRYHSSYKIGTICSDKDKESLRFTMTKNLFVNDQTTTNKI